VASPRLLLRLGALRSVGAHVVISIEDAERLEPVLFVDTPGGEGA
jgi:hypothetical protein